MVGNIDFADYGEQEDLDLENDPAAQALMENIALGIKEIVGSHGVVVLSRGDYVDDLHPEFARIRVFRPDIVITADTNYFDDLYLRKIPVTGAWHANHSRYQKSTVESGSSVGGSNSLELNMQVLQHYSDLLLMLRMQ